MMGKNLDKAKAFRASDEVRHYNCAQAVLCAYAEECGLTVDEAYDLAACFGSGMNMGSVCGAVTGSLMVIGRLKQGNGDKALQAELYRRVKENHDGLIDCRDLLRVMAEKGQQKRPHCDGMIYECLEILEDIL